MILMTAIKLLSPVSLLSSSCVVLLSIAFDALLFHHATSVFSVALAPASLFALMPVALQLQTISDVCYAMYDEPFHIMTQHDL